MISSLLIWPDRLCCSPFWKSMTTSHILVGARNVARRVTEGCHPKGDRGMKCRVKKRTREETCTTWLRSLWTASLGDGSEWDRKRSSKINLNAYLYRFPTVFGKYIRILDQVRKIRQFHSIPFEFQGFKNRPQICFLPFRILYCKPILEPSVSWFAVYRMCNETVTQSK